MEQQGDWFADMLAPGESVVAVLGAAGPPVERKVGQDKIWWQVAATEGRVLAVKLVQGPVGGNYQPQSRLALDRGFVRVRRFPRTDVTAARLELFGMGEPIVLLDIDHEAVFPFVEPFLAAWGGTVEGAGVVRPVASEADDLEKMSSVPHPLLYAAGGAAVMFLLCCGCGFGFGIIRMIFNFLYMYYYQLTMGF